jgi:hypothetical protein
VLASSLGTSGVRGAHASGVLAIGSSRSRTFIVTRQTNYTSSKFVSAECGNQHGATVRSPEAQFHTHFLSSMTSTSAPISAAVRSNPTHCKGHT